MARPTGSRRRRRAPASGRDVGHGLGGRSRTTQSAASPGVRTSAPRRRLGAGPATGGMLRPVQSDVEPRDSAARQGSSGADASTPRPAGPSASTPNAVASTGARHRWCGPSRRGRRLPAPPVPTCQWRPDRQLRPPDEVGHGGCHDRRVSAGRTGGQGGPGPRRRLIQQRCLGRSSREVKVSAAPAGSRPGPRQPAVPRSRRRRPVRPRGTAAGTTTQRRRPRGRRATFGTRVSGSVPIRSTRRGAGPSPGGGAPGGSAASAARTCAASLGKRLVVAAISSAVPRRRRWPPTSCPQCGAARRPAPRSGDSSVGRVVVDGGGAAAWCGRWPRERSGRGPRSSARRGWGRPDRPRVQLHGGGRTPGSIGATSSSARRDRGSCDAARPRPRRPGCGGGLRALQRHLSAWCGCGSGPRALLRCRRRRGGRDDGLDRPRGLLGLIQVGTGGASVPPRLRMAAAAAPGRPARKPWTPSTARGRGSVEQLRDVLDRHGYGFGQGDSGRAPRSRRARACTRTRPD